MLGPIDKRFIAQREAGTMSRRVFLKVTSLAGAGFVVGCGSDPEPAQQVAATASPATAAPPASPPAAQASMNAFVKVGADNTVTVAIKHLDKGQGVTTGLPTIVAEEMDAAWSQMRAEFAPADAERYKNLFFGVQGTGGSTSIANSWQQLRMAGAAARNMLVQAAAAEWGVPEGDITVANGQLMLGDGERKATFGEMAAAAAGMTPPEEPALKQPEDFTLIGTHVPRLDSNAKTDGSAEFTIDVTRPGMLVAVVAHPPRFGATVASFDDSKARAVSGVSDVVQIPRGVAVLADSYWSALQGRRALDVTWNFDAAENRGTDALFDEYRQKMNEAGVEVRNDGDADGALGAAERSVRADFEFPYLAHATMEPMDCVVELTADGCDVYTGSQLQTVDQGIVAQITGRAPEQVRIHTRFAGGSFGRRAVPDSDFVAEAAMIASAIDGRAPVKLQWSREDDMRGGRYRPMSTHRMEATLDDEGNITAWRHRIATQSILTGTPFAGLIQNGIDTSSTEGAHTLPYAIDNLKVELHTMENGVPVLWWRSVGHTHTAYATEVFFDRVAREGGKDPLELRRALLKDHPRHLAVLNLAAEKAGWDQPLPEGRARGIAVHESFNSFVAEVAEVTVADDGKFSVDRIVCAVDCGVAINPDVVKAQMEGGIGYGLSAALREAVTLVDGEVQESNFHAYRPLRINEMPAVEVHIVPSGENPTGVGEPGTPPVAPAVANALMAATGKMIGVLPIGDRVSA
ncbi:MAG: xanthine dehydrogenase family protein molybdopterin-binding subunit [Pseudomonadota bacterium]